MPRLGKGKGASPRINFRLPEALYRELLKLCAEDRRDLSDYLRLVVEDHVAAKRKRK